MTTTSEAKSIEERTVPNVPLSQCSTDTLCTTTEVIALARRDDLTYIARYAAVASLLHGFAARAQCRFAQDHEATEVKVNAELLSQLTTALPVVEVARDQVHGMPGLEGVWKLYDAQVNAIRAAIENAKAVQP